MEPTLELEADALVVLVGPAGCGKSTFAAARFRPTEILSSDAIRAMVTDDVTSQYANSEVFAILHQIAAARLKHRRLTVIDATNLRQADRAGWIDLATHSKSPAIAFVVECTKAQCLAQNRARGRVVPEHVIDTHFDRYRDTLASLPTEGFTRVHFVTPETNITVGTLPVFFAAGWDIIGDVHGCVDELVELINALGYGLMTDDGKSGVRHPKGRRLAFVGDFTDRGPSSPAVLRVVRWLTADGHIAVRGNHDNKLLRALKGNKVKVAHGLAGTLEALADLSETDRAELIAWLDALPYYVRLATLATDEEVVLSHAGLPFDAVGRTSKVIDAHCLYGEVDGKMESGFPRRSEKWRAAWDGSKRTAVFGHTPQMDSGTRNVTTGLVSAPSVWANSVNIDTGCVFGGALTAFQWPERTFRSVDALQEYAQRNPSAVIVETL